MAAFPDPIPSALDLFYVGRAYDFPSITVAGVHLGPGEHAWRATLEGLDDSTRLRIWETWGPVLHALDHDEDIDDERQLPVVTHGRLIEANGGRSTGHGTGVGTISRRHSRPIRPTTVAVLRRGPTAQQWAIVRDTVERFTAMGKWAALSPICRQIPAFEFRWVDAATAPEWFDVTRAAAATQFSQTGDLIEMYLRHDLTDEALQRTVAHELQHLIDVAHIRSGRMPKTVYEQRAKDTAARLTALGPIAYQT